MSENSKRTPRASETRSKTERRKPWRPASSLEAPQPPEGYQFRWVRTEIRGEEDRKNVSGRIREGYELFVQMIIQTLMLLPLKMVSMQESSVLVG